MPLGPCGPENIEFGNAHSVSMVILGIRRTRIPQGAGADRITPAQAYTAGYPVYTPEWAITSSGYLSLKHTLEMATIEFYVPDVSNTDAGRTQGKCISTARTH